MTINREIHKGVQIPINFIHKVGKIRTWSQHASKSTVGVDVKKGWVTLKGKLICSYQREATTLLVNNLASLEELPRTILLKEKAQPTLTPETAEQVFLRKWAVHKRGIQVDLTGTKVTLRGVVDSLNQKQEAERMAWNAPGISRVDNALSIN